MTGSDSWISKVSEVSNSWSVKIFTFHVAVVWPGLNWTCFWALPRKSLSFTAVPSTVPIPKEEGCEKSHIELFFFFQLGSMDTRIQSASVMFSTQSLESNVGILHFCKSRMCFKCHINVTIQVERALFKTNSRQHLQPCSGNKSESLNPNQDLFLALTQVFFAAKNLSSP